MRINSIKNNPNAVVIRKTECGREPGSEEEYLYRVMELAMEAGRILLKNGAEIPRVEETILRICWNLGVEQVDVFVLSNGIFLTARNENKDLFAQVKSIPLSGIHLGVVTEVNSLSRKIAGGNMDLESAFKRLREIDQMPPNRNLYRVIASGIGSACFIYLLGAGFMECAMTLLSGTLVFALVLLMEKRNLSKILVNIAGGAFITMMALVYQKLLPAYDLRMSLMIIGSIFPLIPGFAFVNAIRDIAESDFISGIVRLLDAVFVFVYIAIGVGTVLSLYERIWGGLM